MRLRNLVLAACAAFGLAMPAQAQLTFEWHLVGINAGNTNATAAVNSAVTASQFINTPLVVGDVVTLQLMIRDNHPTGQTFNWGFGNGVIPPPSPPNAFDGTGFASMGATVRGTAGIFAPTGTGAINNRLVPPINNELLGPNSGGGNYPLPAGDFTTATTGETFTPYGSGLGGFGTVGPDASLTPNHTVGIVDGNPWENGDFPRLRPGTTSYLMPWFNMRFTAVAPGAATLTLSQLAGFPNVVAGLGAVPPPGGDMLDGPMFSSYIPLNIQVVPVPEPTSMALVGMAIAGIGYRKLRRNKKTEVVA